MPTLRVEQVQSLREYTELVESLTSGGESLWWRGVGDIDHRLRPSLYRHPTVTEVDELLALESKVVQRFRERSIPYQSLPVLPQNDWNLLFLMQHFGVPTRLLDWTENPFIGLFFAVTSANIDRATFQPPAPAAGWAL